MPIYEYRCNNGHNFEVSQPMADDPVTSCQECGAPVERVFHPIAVHFKGSGFYTTDYARKGGDRAGDGDSSKPDSGSKPSESKSGSDSSKAEKSSKPSDGSKTSSSSD